jgi:hypothetical protein
MSRITTPRKTELGWVIDLPPEIAETLAVEPKSIVLLYAKEGTLATEILPPPTAEVETEFARLWEKHQATMTELQRLGD